MERSSWRNEAMNRKMRAGRFERKLAPACLFVLSLFAVRHPVFAFTILDVAPKIVTPNGDGVNDSLVIRFDNPADLIISRAKIFDLRGAEVGDLQLNAAGNELSWNGRGEDGGIVRSGVYLYEIQVGGRDLTGAVVVAK
jgi:hypothetical protein